MREIIAICRSRKSARDRVATVLDRYFWRIGDRTWRGKASNACLDRVARELRRRASRATAVSIQEIRSSAESRMPIIRIGARAAFSEDGLAPVAAHPSAAARIHGTPAERNGLAAIRIAALFHDLGKATALFQRMLATALQGAQPEASSIRHELFSAVVWDILFGHLDDRALGDALAAVAPADIDAACNAAIGWLLDDGFPQERRLAFAFLADETRLTFAIGMLILTHHRLPEGGTDHLALRGGHHAAAPVDGMRDLLRIAPGQPFWHEDWWLRRLGKDAAAFLPGVRVRGLDIALRGSLVLADHVGSSGKVITADRPDFLANTVPDAAGRARPADSLSTHVRRVYQACRPAFDLFHRLRDRLPALAEDQLPLSLVRPETDDARFVWQVDAARAARALAASAEGGFFACLLSGTGTGKTRGAPTILAGAAFGDKKPERRCFRMTLGLGLRVLATQSAQEYVADPGLGPEDVRVLVGSPVISFPDGHRDPSEDPSGSESLDMLPEWLHIERAEGSVPGIGEAREADWLRGLSLDTDRGIPAILAQLVEADQARSGRETRARTLGSLAAAPVIVATVDHLMAVAAPLRAAFLPAAIRSLTADLILDEIDQYGPEDLAALARLVFQTAAGGRRVIAMSATLTQEVAETLHAAYRAGWHQHAAATGMADHVNLLVTGDAAGSVVTNAGGESFPDLYRACRDRILAALATAPILRRGQILDPCPAWADLITQIDAGCHRMHDLNAAMVDGFRVSVGLIRMTRISHTAALFSQLPAGEQRNRLRVMLCLHSNVPRLHRSWVENRLKQALTRKGPVPEAGIRRLCHAEDLFRRADAIATRDIEIVCVTSPVIETGNDLDFDYAILDPVSLRSIVQAAGRVRRHRPAAWPHTNILILGRSPIVMQGGSLAMPGVETDLPRDTAVSRGTLAAFPDRHFRDLAGSLSFDRIDAAPLLTDRLACPLRDAEAAVQRAMLALSGENAPLGRYLERSTARMNARFTKTRMFRRSTTRNLLYALSGDGFENATWQVNMKADRKTSVWITPELHLASPGKAADAGFLFTDILARAWRDLSGEEEPMTSPVMRRLVSLDIADYGSDRTILPVMTYGEQTGFTRNLPDDLSKPFGKS